MAANIEIEQKVLDGEQVGPVTVNFSNGADLVGDVTIQDRLLDGEGTEINIEVSESLGIVGVEELVEINTEIKESANKAEEAANKAADLINQAEEERLQLEKDIQHIQDLSDKTEKNATIATNKAAEATQQAGIATSQADLATQSKNEATRQATLAGQKATIATDKANVATQQATTATAQAGIATNQANTATTKAAEAAASANAAKAAADTAAKDTSDKLEAHFASQVAEATKQAGIASTQANIASTQAQSASASATSATSSKNEATKQAGIATAQAQAAASSNSDAKAQADRAKREADRSAAQVALATAQAKIATDKAAVATTQADLAAQSASAANQSKIAAAAEVGKAAAAGSKAVQDKFNLLEPTMDQKVTDATNQADRAKAEADKSAASASTASSKATIATTKATEASNSASAALGSKNAAASSASAAASSQTATSQLKDDVTALKGDVTTLKNQAVTAKDTAVQQAGNAARSATTSTTQADRSKNEADRAKTIADSLQDISGGKFGVVSLNGQVGVIENFDYTDVNAKPASYVPSWGEISGKPTLFTQANADALYWKRTEKVTNASNSDTASTVKRSYAWSVVSDDFNSGNGGTGCRLYWHGSANTNGPLVSPGGSKTSGYGFIFGDTQHGSQIDFAYGDNIAFRGLTAGTWGNWEYVYTTKFKPTPADIGAHPTSWVPSWGDVTGKPNVAVQGANVSFDRIRLTAPSTAITLPNFHIEAVSGLFRVVESGVSNRLTIAKGTGVLNNYGEIRENNQRVYSPNNKPTIDAINPIITKTKSLKLVADTWTNLLGNIDIPASGVYTILVEYTSNGHGGTAYDQHYTGQFYWYSGNTNNNNTSEIPLHHMGLADNGEIIYLRTQTTLGSAGTQQLQIRCDNSFTNNVTFTVKLRRIM